MPIIDIYSRRQRRQRGEFPDVFQYSTIPPKLRGQALQIIADTIGEFSIYSKLSPIDLFEIVRDILRREYGVTSLTDQKTEVASIEVRMFVLKTTIIDRVLDVIELSFQLIEKEIGSNPRYSQDVYNVRLTPTEAIQDLNERFRENGVGYSYESGQIIRIDSTVTHSEIIKPALLLLSNTKFSGANEEFLSALDHYKRGKNKECLSDCLKALESVLKTICVQKNWPFSPTDTARKLIQIVFNNNLVPTFTQNQFTSLQNLLESGIPTIRNKLSAHGQGQVPQIVDDEIARYGLNLSGTNIILLIELSGIK